MGDWIRRTYWAVAPDEVTALEIYERLEEVADRIRLGGSFDRGPSVLRFGLGSPRLVIAVASQKWGESPAIEHELERTRGVELLITDEDRFFIGSIDALDPEHVFVWTGAEPTDAELGRAGFEEVQVGGARVRVLDAKTGARFR